MKLLSMKVNQAFRTMFRVPSHTQTDRPKAEVNMLHPYLRGSSLSIIHLLKVSSLSSGGNWISSSCASTVGLGGSLSSWCVGILIGLVCNGISQHLL